jgi:hypothetical protein
MILVRTTQLLIAMGESIPKKVEPLPGPDEAKKDYNDKY